MDVKLGSIATDSITGFRGVVVSRTEYIHGCTRVGVQPKELHDGKPGELQYFDELAIVENAPARTDKTAGGPNPVPPMREVPRR